MLDDAFHHVEIKNKTNSHTFSIDIILNSELNQLFQVENAEFGGGEGKEENVIVNCTL
jgi:ABC-type cobalt transport system substrate-binding protein